MASDAYTAIHQLHHTDVSTVRVTEEEDQHDVDSDSASDDFSEVTLKPIKFRFGGSPTPFEKFV